MNKWRTAFILFVILALAVILTAPLWSDNAYWWMDTDQMLQRRPHRPAFEANPITAGAGLLINLAALFWGGVFILYLLTRPIQRMASDFDVGLRPLFRLSGLGLAITLFALLTAGAMAMTPITAPMAFLLVLLLLLAAFVGTTALGMALGRWITSKCGWEIESPLLIFGLGTLVLTLLFRFPYVGIGFIVLAYLIGLGLITTTRLGSGQTWTLEPLVEEKVDI